jgi:hypothetical protein
MVGWRQDESGPEGYYIHDDLETIYMSVEEKT